MNKSIINLLLFLSIAALFYNCSDTSNSSLSDTSVSDITPMFDIQNVDIVSPDVYDDSIEILRDTIIISSDSEDEIEEDSILESDTIVSEEPAYDAGIEDIDDISIKDIGVEDSYTDIACKETKEFDYNCEPDKPETCPKGLCILKQCIAPELDPYRWSECGDGSCSVCEDSTQCPADCREPYQFKNEKIYDGSNTITVWVHGFYNKKPEDIKKMVYGKDRGCSDIEKRIKYFGIDRLCSNESGGSNSPTQFTSVEYYGAVPAEYLTQKDIDEIEQYPYDTNAALHRYALIVAKFIKYKLSKTGASHINLACHSMGCLISRYMIENDIENLATENRIVRWFTSAGVVAGARLAKLYDNPTVQDTANLIGLELSDFVVMHPDFVMDYAARWDHKLYEGNSPLFKGVYITHFAATDPKIKDAMNIALLDLNNPGDEPNDGIMYTLDEYFHSQKDTGAFFTPAGRKLEASHSYYYVDHMTLPDTDSAAILATAGLFHKRRVTITLKDVLLKNDRENHSLFDGEHGKSPAEISPQIEVRYNPYIKTRYGIDTSVHFTSVEHRSADLFVMNQDEEKSIDLKLFDGPVFDGMDKLYLSIKLLEIDYYPRFNIKEWSFDIHQELASYNGYVDLRDNSFTIENNNIKATISIEVLDIY